MNWVFLVAFIGLPLIYYALSRSLTRLALGVGAVLTISGGVVELAVAQNVEVRLVNLQWLLLAGLAALAIVGIGQQLHDHGSSFEPVSWRRQFTAVWLPALAIGLVLVSMRFMAGADAGPLTGVGFLANHTSGEDNSKWLQLASLMATDRPLSFVGGYSGGPLIMLMTAIATFTSVLSTTLLGGVNQVAVVVGTVIGSSMTLLALTPFALAPLAETRVPWRRTDNIARQYIPVPVVWTGVLALFSASGAVFTYGHLSLQFVLPLLVLWAGVYLVGRHDHHSRLLASVLAIGAAVVWFPLVPLGLAVLAMLLGWAVVSTISRARSRRMPDWPLLGLVTGAFIAGWDGLISAAMWVVGFGGSASVTSQGLGGAVRGVAASVGTAVSSLVRAESSIDLLFNSPGGTEMPTPLLTALAFGALLLSISLVARGLRRIEVATAYAPLLALGLFALGIALADALITGKGNNYATLKLMFTVTIVVITVCTPVAIVALEPMRQGMTLVRWTAVVGLLFLLSIDTIFPRAIGQYSPTMWRPPSTSALAYVKAFEVRPVASQDVSTLPIACVFLPPGAEVPSGQPNGQVAYNCTRLAVGLSGAEGRVGGLTEWLLDDWLNNGRYWSKWRDSIKGVFPEIQPKPVVQLDLDNSIDGIDTLQGLIRRFPSQPAR